MKESKETKGDVDPVSGFRSGLQKSFNRPLSELKPLVPSISLARTTICINHGLSRIIEKLLTLTVTSAGRLASEASAEEHLSAISHLTKNIQSRGVRGGTFNQNSKTDTTLTDSPLCSSVKLAQPNCSMKCPQKIYVLDMLLLLRFKQDGSVDDITLNTSHALVIISFSDYGGDHYSPLLENVSSTSIFPEKLPP